MTVWLVLSDSDSHDCHRDILFAICSTQTEAERICHEVVAKDFYFQCENGHVSGQPETCGARLFGGITCGAKVRQVFSADRYRVKEVELGSILEDVSVANA